jgi:hypothetical protein
MSRKRLADGFSALRRAHFDCEPESGICNLALELARDEGYPAEVLRIVFSDVSSLQMREMGGGLTQILCLSIEDRKEEQLDRKRYFVSELETQNISFWCSKFGTE